MNSKQRLDQALVARKLVATRSQAESYIKLGYVKVGREVVTKPGLLVADDAVVTLRPGEQYVSRAALKLASVAQTFGLDFEDKVVLDVGSSTGGFTDYALKHGACKVVAVDVGTDQLHPSLRTNPKIELHEQTDIRDFVQRPLKLSSHAAMNKFDVVVIDVSFISLSEILPPLDRLIGAGTQVVAMVKPQFEAGRNNLKHKGVVKNEKMRRDILKQFENWVQKVFIIANKADSGVPGARGNRERFYLLKKSTSQLTQTRKRLP